MEQYADIKRESTVKDFLEVVFRRKWIILGIIATATAVTTVITLRQPALYESAAKILVRRGETPGVYDATVRTLTWEEEISSQIEMIKSQVAVSRAQELLPKYLPEGYKPAERIALARVAAGVVSTSNVIWVTYNSEDPAFCRAAVDAVVNAYKDYYTGIRTPPAMEDFFAQEMQRLEDEIEYWRSRKEKVLEQSSIVDLEVQRAKLVERLTNYEIDLDRVIVERKDKEAAIAGLEKLRSSSFEELAAASSQLTDSRIEEAVTRELLGKLQNLVIEQSELATQFTENNPEVVRLRQQIADLQALVSKEIDTQILINRTQLGVLLQREEALREIAQRLAAQKATYPRTEVELERIDATLEKLKDTYGELVQEHMAAKIAVASNPEWTVTILNPASPAYRKATRDYVRMALGPIFSLIVALGLAFFVDNLDHSIKSIAEAEENLGLSVLANFPETNRK